MTLRPILAGSFTQWEAVEMQTMPEFCKRLESNQQPTFRHYFKVEDLLALRKMKKHPLLQRKTTEVVATSADKRQ